MDIDREMYEDFAREGFRQHILKQLGMKEAPNLSAGEIPEHVRKHMVRKYRKPHLMGGNNAAGLQADQSHQFPTRLVTIFAKNGE